MPISADRRKIIFLWAALCALLLMAVWAGITLEIVRDREVWQARVVAEVRNKSAAHADQVQKLIAQIDQLSVVLAAAQQTGTDVDLLNRQCNAQSDAGYFFYADATGTIRQSCRPSEVGQSVRDQQFFRFHRLHDGRDLRIHPPLADSKPGSGAEVIWLARRVNSPTGDWNGLIVFVVPPTYFHLSESDKESGFVGTTSMWLLDQSAGSYSATALDHASVKQYRNRPEFESQAGARQEPGEQFYDSETRFVGWKKLARYPLVSVAVLRQEKMMSRELDLEKSHLMVGLVATVLLLLSAGAGVQWQLRRNAQTQEMDDIRSTFRLAIDGAREAFYILNPELDKSGNIVRFRLEDCNEHAAKIVGCDRNALLGKQITDIFFDDDAGQIIALLRRTMHVEFIEDELELHGDALAEKGWFNFRAVRSSTGIAVTVRNISDIKEKEAQLKAMALMDALTMLPNRHWLNQFLPGELEAASRSDQQLALFFIDLDDFKKINDTQGHQAGDQFLSAVATALQNAMRSDDQVVRLGGDEFTLLSKFDACTDITAIAEKIFASLADVDCSAVGRGFQVNASVGVAIFPRDATDAQSLMQAADVAMYAAKAAGKAQLKAYSSGMVSQIQAKQQLEQDLKLAVKRDELFLNFQPRACSASGELICMEVLLRWQHPQRGLISPIEFIPLAEESNLIVDIGDWVVEKSCWQLAQWRLQGHPLTPLSINVSGRQLRSNQFRLQMAASMQTHGIAANLLAIELTESMMVADEPVVKEELRLLRKMGIELHIDDFGTGYSSLSQLQKLDIDVIKIDQSFVQAIGVQEQGRTLCEAMVQIGRTMGFRVVAEGVETLAQLRELQHMRCDEIQGYLVSPPVSADQVSRLLRRKKFFEPAFPVVQRTVTRLAR